MNKKEIRAVTANRSKEVFEISAVKIRIGLFFTKKIHVGNYFSGARKVGTVKTINVPNGKVEIALTNGEIIVLNQPIAAIYGRVVEVVEVSQ